METSEQQCRRGLGLAPVAAAVASLLVAVTGHGPADAAAAVRIAGSDRVATAVEASRAGWDRAEDVVLATAVDYPDALAGGSLAAELQAPLLLSAPDRLSPNVLAELQRLGAERVWLLGGPGALSALLETDLREAGLSTERIAGADRFETAAALARRVGAPDGEVIVALGTHADISRAWPDALAAGAFAARGTPPPILLTTSSVVPEPTLRALTDGSLGSVEKIRVIGGAAAVSDQVVGQLESLGHTVVRLSGPDRFSTSVAVADHVLGGQDGTIAVLAASGVNFPDALSAAGLAARTGAVILLVPPDDLAGAPLMTDWLSRNTDRIRAIGVMGGSAAISDAVTDQLVVASGGPSAGATQSDVPLTAWGDRKRQLTDTQARLAAPSLCTFEVVAARTLSPDEALDHAHRHLEETESDQALAAFTDSAAATDPRLAEVAAVAALADGRPGAALAALLAAHAAEPDEPGHLVDIAGLLNNANLPNEALALLDAADGLGAPIAAMGIDGTATALVNRGNALLRTGRYDAARAAYETAYERAPELTEAARGAAAAEICKELAAGASREDAVTDRALRAYQAGTFRREYDLSVLGDGSRAAPLDELYDLTAGVPGTLPAFPLPESAAAAHALRPYYQSLIDSYSDRRIALGEDNRTPAPADWATTNWRNDIRLTVRTSLSTEPLLSQLRPLYDEHGVLHYEFLDWYHSPEQPLGTYCDGVDTSTCVDSDYEELFKHYRFDVCGDAEDHDACMYANYTPKCVPALAAIHNRWLDMMGRLQDNLRERIEIAHPIQTSIAAHLSDPGAHDEATELIAADELSLWFELAAQANMWSMRLDATGYSHDDYCINPEPPAETPDDGEPDNGTSEICPPEVQDEGLQIGINDIFAVTFKCDTIELELGTPSWFGPFVQVSGKNDLSSFTVFAGLKESAQIGRFLKLGGTAKQGVYITVDGNGTLTDGGFRFAHTASGGAGPAQLSVDAPNVDVSVVSALTPPYQR